MADVFWGRNDRGRTSQHPMDHSLSFSYVAGFHPISNVWCSSGVCVVFWYVVKLSHGRWHSCVKGAVECQLVVVMVLVFFGACYVLQDVWVWHYFYIAVLIRDRVVVTCWMIFRDLFVERAVSWKSFGDSHVKEWVTVIRIFFVGIVLFQKILFSCCDCNSGSLFKDCRRALLPWWDASAFVVIIIRSYIRFGRVLFVSLFRGYCIIVDLLSFWTKRVVNVWFWWDVVTCCVLPCAAACVRL